jgi:hypothetical protein
MISTLLKAAESLVFGRPHEAPSFFVSLPLHNAENRSLPRFLAREPGLHRVTQFLHNGQGESRPPIPVDLMGWTAPASGIAVPRWRTVQ